MSQKITNEIYEKKHDTKCKIFKSKEIIPVYILLITEVIFFWSIIELHIIPLKYLSILGVICAFIDVDLLIMQIIKPIRVLSVILASILAIIFATCIFYIQFSKNALTKVVESETVIDNLCVYVQSKSNISALEDIQENHRLGVLADIDRKNTNKAIEEINSIIESDIIIEEYASVVDLTRALTKDEVDIILLNDAHSVLVNEAPELINDFMDFRIIWSVEMKRDLDLTVRPKINFDTNQGQKGNELLQKIIPDKYSIINSPFALYVSGNDSEGELKSNGRSDINVIAIINPNTKKILLINTPRDYYVNLAGIDKMDKLTHAGMYGVDESIRTLEQVYEIPIQYFVRVNFTGFIDIIDAMGGISVYSDVDFTVAEWHYNIGENYLSGIEALAFARERYSFATGDRQRVKNQQAVIEGVINKVCSPQILSKYIDVVNVSTDVVDTNMAMEEISDLVLMQLENNVSWEISSVLVTGKDAHEFCFSTQNISYVMLPDEASLDRAREAIKEIINE